MRRFSNKQAKTARITNLAKSTFRKRKNQEGLREVRKFRKKRDPGHISEDEANQ